MKVQELIRELCKFDANATVFTVDDQGAVSDLFWVDSSADDNEEDEDGNEIVREIIADDDAFIHIA
jgi:hypothetical protein